jgi:hypothetical protein
MSLPDAFLKLIWGCHNAAEIAAENARSGMAESMRFSSLHCDHPSGIIPPNRTFYAFRSGEQNSAGVVTMHFGL